MERKTWAEKWGESPVNYAKPKTELAKELKKVRNLTARRTASLEKKSAYSYANYQFKQSMEKNYIHGQQPDVNQMSYRQIERELRIHHQFWSSKTATEAGAKAEQYAQSKRIFGETKSGKPRRLLGIEEAKKFWSVYDEFYNMYKEGTAKYDSNRVQQLIGEQMSSVDLYDVDMIQLLEDVRESLEKEFNPFESSLEMARKMNKEVFNSDGNDFYE